MKLLLLCCISSKTWQSFPTCHHTSKSSCPGPLSMEWRKPSPRSAAHPGSAALSGIKTTEVRALTMKFGTKDISLSWPQLNMDFTQGQWNVPDLVQGDAKQAALLLQSPTHNFSDSRQSKQQIIFTARRGNSPLLCSESFNPTNFSFLCARLVKESLTSTSCFSLCV